MQEFLFLKNKLVSTPIIVAPYWNLPFELMCDASNYVISAQKVLFLALFKIGFGCFLGTNHIN